MQRTRRFGMAVLAAAMVAVTGCAGGQKAAPAGGGAAQQAPAAGAQPGQPAQPAQQAEFTLKLGHVGAPDHSWNLAARRFADLVAERTRGRVKISVFPSGQLGGDRQMLEALQLGTQDLGAISTQTMGSFEPRVQVWDLPYIFPNDYAKVDAIVDGPIGKELAGYLEQKGFRVLAYWENDWRQISNSKRPVKKLEDLKGLKLRIPETPVLMAWFKSVGVQPTPMAFPEVYNALQQGVVDGQDNGVLLTYSSRFHEVQKHYTLTRHIYAPVALVVSTKVWAKLPAEVQKVMADTAAEVRLYQRELNRSTSDKNLKAMEQAGMQVVRLGDAELAEFRKTAAPIYQQFEGVIGKDLIERMVQAAR